MNGIDWFVIACVGIAALHGVFRGWIKETAHLLALVIGLFAAWHLGRFVEPALGGYLAATNVRIWAARGIVVLAVLATGAVSGTVAAHHVKAEKLKALDRPLGGGLGVLRGILVLGVLVLVGQVLHMDDASWWKNSRLLPYGEAVADGVRVLVGEERHRRHLVDLGRHLDKQGLRSAGPAKAA
jgi:membrane protein required for colicin V production